MNKKTFFILWGALFILCAALGFLPEPGGVVKSAMTAASL